MLTWWWWHLAANITAARTMLCFKCGAILHHLLKSFASTTDHSFIPWHSGQKHQHISKYLPCLSFEWRGLLLHSDPSRIRPITVTAWVQPGSPLGGLQKFSDFNKNCYSFEFESRFFLECFWGGADCMPAFYNPCCITVWSLNDFMQNKKNATLD